MDLLQIVDQAEGLPLGIYLGPTAQGKTEDSNNRCTLKAIIIKTYRKDNNIITQ
jgi:hypothetical protein